jgi:hypothetical protein
LTAATLFKKERINKLQVQARTEFYCPIDPHQLLLVSFPQTIALAYQMLVADMGVNEG